MKCFSVCVCVEANGMGGSLCDVYTFSRKCMSSEYPVLPDEQKSRHHDSSFKSFVVLTNFPRCKL